MQKKFIVILVALAFFMGSFTGNWATADTNLPGALLYVNNDAATDGKEFFKDIVWKDERIYVPLRFVSEKMGAAVEWDGKAAHVNMGQQRPKIYYGGAYAGDEKFRDTINQALDLLEKYDPPHYTLVCSYCRGILVADKDDMSRFVKSPNEAVAFQLGVHIMINESLVNSKEFLPNYVAGILTHEAVHICNSVQDFAYYDDNNEVDEIMACEHEKTALKLLNVPQWMIDEADNYENTFK